MTVEIFQKSIKEVPVEGKPLGRHVVHDPRSRNFEAAQARVFRSVRHEAHGLPLDQTRGSCTAEALLGALDSSPDFEWKGSHVYAQDDAEALYDLEIKLEGGDPATDDPGGSGLMVCKAAKQMSLIDRYENAFGLDHALKALTLRPVITGVNWYSSFDTPNQDGVVEISSDAYIRGGHEIVADEIILERRLVGLWNSWGPGWGPIGGRFYWSFETWDRLLHEYGDVTVPLVRKPAAAATEQPEEHRGLKAEVFTDQAGAHRWRVKASNGEIVAASQGYTRRENAVRGLGDAGYGELPVEHVD